MAVREALIAELTARFSSEQLRIGTPPAPLVVFPAKHPDVGDVTIEHSGLDANFSVSVAVGAIIVDHFSNYDVHLDSGERERRLIKDVVRFLEELFADRLLCWRSTDGRNAGWRELGNAGCSEPLVLDNRVYRTYLWSGPLSQWQAVPTILARGRIQDEREYAIMFALLEESGPTRLEGTDLDRARKLVADYEREPADLE